MHLAIFAVIFCVAHRAYSYALPARNGYYMGKSGVLFGGYYSNPNQYTNGYRYRYDPQGSMTAIVSGDAVATNTFNGGLGPWGWSQDSPEQQPNISEDTGNEEDENVGAASEKNSVEEVDNSSNIDDEELVPVTRKSVRKSSKKPVATAGRPHVEYDERKDAQIPSFFFPVSISNPSRPSSGGRQGNDWASNGGPPIAIANAVSTGRGGVATSHATAFADPNAWSSLARGVAADNGGRRTRRQGRS